MSAERIPVCLHCHSSWSDGAFTPEQLAGELAARGVRYAALTDHDTLAGLASFREALARLGVAAIAGVEMSVASSRGELHLLAYGFDPDDPGLSAVLEASRRHADAGMQGLVDSLKRLGGRAEAPPAGLPDPGQAIRAVHAAGGAVFLAHPLSYSFGSEALESVVRELSAAGLDGLEALYSPYSEPQVRLLLDLAARLGLAVSAGGDFHGPGLPGDAQPLTALDPERWEAFRAVLLRGRAGGGPRPEEHQPPAASPREARRLRPGRFAARIVLPTLTAVVLFVLAFFVLIIPRFQAILLERKKEMIRELTNSAVSILAEYAAEERAGRLSRAEAQAAAAGRLRDMRYNLKDYFWITDLEPRMIMHPYRRELEGTDVSGYTDANGVRVFVEFAEAVREKDEGYVEYLWQWMDDAQRIVPKLSFVERFQPWNWVVGTGIYMDDVNAEIRRVTGSLIRLSAGIVVLLALLLAFVVQQSLAVEKSRRQAEQSLRESHERYRTLVEASGEGQVVVIDGACAYANTAFRRMLGYTDAELALLTVADLVRPYPGQEQEARAFLATVASEEARAAGSRLLACGLQGREGKPVDVLLSASGIRAGGRPGAILTAREVGSWQRLEGGGGELRALWQESEVALFLATWGRRAFLLDCNPAARSLLLAPGGERTDLFSLFADPREAERVFAELAATGRLRERELALARSDGSTRIVRLSAALARAPDGAIRHLEALACDLTELRRQDRRREELLAEQETSSLFLSRPLAAIARRVPTVELESSLRDAAARMTREKVDCLLVAGPSGEPLGIVTDRDMRERVVAAQADPGRPVREFMSSPLVWAPAGALVYEAVLLMRDRGLAHLLVREGGRMGVVRALDLLQLQRHSPAVLGREIAAAAGVEQVADCRGRLLELVRGLAASGVSPRSTTRIYNALADRILARLIELAVAELGPPPAPFVFLALGSEGRQERTPGSDQDSAILFDAEGPAESERRYLLALGARVCAGLEAMGVPRCAGGAMADNPSWCATFQQWQAYFAGWIRQPEPRELLDFNIFFDLRAAGGEAGLAERLRTGVSALLAENPPFFLHHARDARGRRLPAWPKGGRLDAKEAMAPIVSFARLYALKHGARAAGTRERLEELRERSLLDGGLVGETLQAYDLLSRLRLEAQLAGSGNLVDCSALPHAEQTLLRESLGLLSLLQKRIGFDFLGGTG